MAERDGQQLGLLPTAVTAGEGADADGCAAGAHTGARDETTAAHTGAGSKVDSTHRARANEAFRPPGAEPCSAGIIIAAAYPDSGTRGSSERHGVGVAAE